MRPEQARGDTTPTGGPKWEAAADSARRAESIAERHFATDNARVTPIRVLLAAALRGTGDFEAAAKLLESMLSEQRSANARAALIADTQYELALPLEAQRDRAQATKYMRSAGTVFRTDGAHELRVATIDAWLAKHGRTRAKKSPLQRTSEEE